MGMTVTGDPSSVWAFRFACSSAISPLEEQVLSSIIQGSIGLSVTSFLGQLILCGGLPETFMSNGYVVFKVKGIDDFVLMLDPKTGIVRDVMTSSIYGVYCFHDQLTTNTIQLAGKLNSTNPDIQSTFPIIIGGALKGVVKSVPSIFGSLEIGVSLEFLGVLAGPVLLDGAVLSVIECTRPELVADAERDGLFNLAEYIRNTNALDMQWDYVTGSQPQGVWDESYEYSYPNIQRNLEDIKNMKEGARAVWDGILELFLPDHVTTLEEVEYAYWASVNLLILLAEDDDTKLLNEIINLGNIYPDENYDPRLKKDKKAEAQKNVDDYFKKRNPGINLNLGSGNIPPTLTKVAVAITIIYIIARTYEPINEYFKALFSNIKKLVIEKER
jgi:hypothetical protein